MPDLTARIRTATALVRPSVRPPDFSSAQIALPSSFPHSYVNPLSNIHGGRRARRRGRPDRASDPQTRGRRLRCQSCVCAVLNQVSVRIRPSQSEKNARRNFCVSYSRQTLFASTDLPTDGSKSLKFFYASSFIWRPTNLPSLPDWRTTPNVSYIVLISHFESWPTGERAGSNYLEVGEIV